MELISAFFSFMANAFGLAKQRDAEKNTAAVAGAAAAAKWQKAQDEITKAVANRNVDEVRKIIAE